MKKLQLLLLSGLILFAACSENDTQIEKEQPGETVSKLPTIIAKAEPNAELIKAGVVEDDDYTLGENFYWSNADQTVVLFADADNKYYRTDYAADVLDGVKSNTASFNFIRSEIMPIVTYTAYGFFPHDVWNFNQQDITTPFLTANVPTVQTQSDATSAHLGSYMLLKAKKENVTLGSKPIELNYKHLSSVIRYAVWNDSDIPSLKLTNISMKLASGKSVFPTSGKLSNITDEYLTIQAGTQTSSLVLRMEGSAQNFAEKNSKQQCEGYIAVLPTAYNAFDPADDLIIELSLTDGTDNYIIEKKYNVATYLSFLSEGIKQGNSYYFQMKVSPADLVITHARQYAIGDLWPDAASPHGIVYWLKPGSFGTKGKVMSLVESESVSWGSSVDELINGVADIRNLYYGATATKNLIAKHRGNLLVLSGYPIFNETYLNVNGRKIDGEWYIPAREELRALYAGYSGLAYESIHNWTIGSMPDYDSQACINARSNFNAKLSSVLSNPLDPNTPYWSSTEISRTQSYSVYLNNGAYIIDVKTLDANCRWIREF